MLNKNPYDKTPAEAELADSKIAPSDAMKSMLNSKHPASQGNPAVGEVKEASENAKKVTLKGNEKGKKAVKGKRATGAKKATQKTNSSKQLDDCDAEHIVSREKADEAMKRSLSPPLDEDGRLLEVLPTKSLTHGEPEGLEPLFHSRTKTFHPSSLNLKSFEKSLPLLDSPKIEYAPWPETVTSRKLAAVVSKVVRETELDINNPDPPDDYEALLREERARAAKRKILMSEHPDTQQPAPVSKGQWAREKKELAQRAAYELHATVFQRKTVLGKLRDAQRNWAARPVFAGGDEAKVVRLANVVSFYNGVIIRLDRNIIGLLPQLGEMDLSWMSAEYDHFVEEAQKLDHEMEELGISATHARG